MKLDHYQETRYERRRYQVWRCCYSAVGRVFDDGDQAGDHPKVIFGRFAADQI